MTIDVWDDDQKASAQTLAAISEALVRVHRDFLGRGPGSVRSSQAGDLLVIVMEDVFTKAEQTLIAAGKEDVVLRARESLQATMRADIVAAVEGLLRRRVVAFMSSSHVRPDLACEILLLGSSIDGAFPSAA
jgi:uncharacterized protein YbcI